MPFDVASNIQTAADELYVQLRNVRNYENDTHAFAKRLAEIFRTRKVRFLKLAALLRWRESSSAAVHKNLQALEYEVQSRSRFSDHLNNALGLLNEQSKEKFVAAATPDAKYDLRGSLRVLSGQAYDLPHRLTNWISQNSDRLSVATVKRELDHIILQKLMQSELPAPPCKSHVGDGCLVVKSPHLYTLHLSLTPIIVGDSSAATAKCFGWKVMAFEFHVEPRRSAETFKFSKDQKSQIAKRLGDKIEEFRGQYDEAVASNESGAPVQDKVLSQGLHVYMLSVCRQLQMAILRRQFSHLQSRSYVAGLHVLQSPANAIALEYVQCCCRAMEAASMLLTLFLPLYVAGIGALESRRVESKRNCSATAFRSK